MDNTFLCGADSYINDYGQGDEPDDEILLTRWIQINHNNNANERDNKITTKSSSNNNNTRISSRTSSSRMSITGSSNNNNNNNNSQRWQKRGSTFQRIDDNNSIITAQSCATASPSLSVVTVSSSSSNNQRGSLYGNRLEEMERQMELLESDVVLHKKMCRMEELILQRDEEIQLLQKQVQGLLLKQNEHEMKMNSQENNHHY